MVFNFKRYVRKRIGTGNNLNCNKYKISEVFMNITINGDIYITNYGQTLDEIVGNNDDLENSFNFFIDDEDGDCEGNCNDCDFDDCEFYEEDDEDEETDIDEIVDDITDFYTEILCEDFCCPECTKKILVDMIHGFIEAL